MTTLSTLGRCAAVLSSVALFAGYMWYQTRAAAPAPLALEGRGVGGEGAAYVPSASARPPGTSAPAEELDPAAIAVPPEVLRRAALMPGSKSSAFDLVHASGSNPGQSLVIVEPPPEYTPFEKIDASETYSFAAPAKNADPRPASQKQAEDAKRQVLMLGSKSGAVFKEYPVVPYSGETAAPQRRVLMTGSKFAVVGVYKSDRPDPKAIPPKEPALAAPAQSAVPVASGAGVPARQPEAAASSAAPRQATRELDTSFRYTDPAPPPEPSLLSLEGRDVPASSRRAGPGGEGARNAQGVTDTPASFSRMRRRVLMSSSKSGRVYEGEDLPPIRVPKPSQSAKQK